MKFVPFSKRGTTLGPQPYCPNISLVDGNKVLRFRFSLSNVGKRLFLVATANIVVTFSVWLFELILLADRGSSNMLTKDRHDTAEGEQCHIQRSLALVAYSPVQSELA